MVKNSRNCRKNDSLAGKLLEALVKSDHGYYGMPEDVLVSSVFYTAKGLEELGIRLADGMMCDNLLTVMQQIFAESKNSLI